MRTLLNLRVTASTFFKQQRNAEVVNNPLFFYGHKNNWERINRIAAEASRVKINYDAKYANKLKAAAQKHGLSVQELKDNVKAVQNTSNRLVVPKPVTKKKPEEKKTKTTQTTLAPESTAPALDKIMKVELLKDEDKESIGRIWTEYYADKDGISAVIPSDTYNTMFEASQKYPLFILPMPRENGLEFFYLQFHFHQCILTSLLEYKTRKEKARPYLTLTHFNELSETKDIVLMRGELLDPKILSSANAQFLAFALQTFYCSKNNLKLVKTFNENPEHFDYEELIQEMDKLVPLS